MLIIRKEQMEVFRQYQLRTFFDNMEQSLKKNTLGRQKK